MAWDKAAKWRKRLKRLPRFVGRELLSQALLSGSAMKLLVSTISASAATVWAFLQDVPEWTLPFLFVGFAVLVLLAWTSVVWLREQAHLDDAIDKVQSDITQQDWIRVPKRAPASAQELTRPYVADRFVRIADLTKGTALLDSRTFDDCTIIGPAIVLQVGTGLMQGSSHDGPVDRLFIEIPRERMNTAPVGVVYARDCVFRRCHFSGVGFMGTPTDVAKWKKQVREV